MIAVAIAAVAIERRRADFLRRAARNGFMEEVCLLGWETNTSGAENLRRMAANERRMLAEMREEHRREARGGDPARSILSRAIRADQLTPDRHEAEAARDEREAASQSRRALWHSRLRRKYERAARYPWRSVEPDPNGKKGTEGINQAAAVKQ